MTARSPSEELILAATRIAIAARGPDGLTMSAVAAAAGVSRPTLYKWFPTKADLFGALTVYETEQFDAALRAAIDAHRSPARRLDAALRHLVTYLDGLMGADPVGVDPAFALASLNTMLDGQVAVLTDLLSDALDVVPAVAECAITRRGAAEMFLRLAYSQYLVPNPDTEEMLATMRGFAGLGRRR